MIQLDCTDTLADIEKKAITYYLEFFKGNKTEAAKALKIGRATMYRKLHQYSIQVQQPIAKPL
jgi:DNA-binding NtrC family response regulator